MNEMTMGQRIAEQRKKLGLSQEGLGEKVGVSRQAISKWESDGTVPEIDKLISLSRLFCVSVGWLLGVEEDTPPQPDELTETQLKMVEEIVRRYQPQPEKKKFPWAIAVAVFACVLAIAALLRNPVSVQDYTEIAGLRSGYQSIQNELQSLSGRVEDIASAAEEGEKLLQSHEFQLVSLNRTTNTAILSFTAYPKKWAQDSTGWLSISREGEQVFYEACDWNGASCAVQAELPIADGYEYCFILHQGDGTQQIQILEEYNYDALAYGTSLHCNLTSSSFSYNPRTWTFVMDRCYITAEKPTLGDFADIRWTEAGLILYQNGGELERRTVSYETNTGNYELYLEYFDLNFRNVKLEENDQLVLTFYAALENGMSIETAVGRWTLKSGALISLTEE